jgi:hypothetical protein
LWRTLTAMSAIGTKADMDSLSNRCSLSGVKRTYRKGANRSKEISFD